MEFAIVIYAININTHFVFVKSYCKKNAVFERIFKGEGSTRQQLSPAKAQMTPKPLLGQELSPPCLIGRSP